MVTVDCHLHLGVIDQHTPAWWWWEQFGFEPASVDGEAIIEFLASAGLDGILSTQTAPMTGICMSPTSSPPGSVRCIRIGSME
jgi:hypothetical protein